MTAPFPAEQETHRLSQDEITALWTYHHEEELRYADKGEYADAQHHKLRANFWRGRMSHG